MDPEFHALDNLSHAQWKVNFLRSLLQAHLTSSWKGTLQWQEQHAHFLHKLASAEEELKVSLDIVKTSLLGPGPSIPAPSAQEAGASPDRD